MSSCPALPFENGVSQLATQGCSSLFFAACEDFLLILKPPIGDPGLLLLEFCSLRGYLFNF